MDGQILYSLLSSPQQGDFIHWRCLSVCSFVCSFVCHLRVTVYRCLQGRAPQYLVNCCHPTLDVASRQWLRSSIRHHLVVLQHSWPSGIFPNRSDGLECVAWQPPRPVTQCRQFQKDAKDASVSECTWTLSALEALRNALYKFKTYFCHVVATTKGVSHVSSPINPPCNSPCEIYSWDGAYSWHP